MFHYYVTFEYCTYLIVGDNAKCIKLKLYFTALALIAFGVLFKIDNNNNILKWEIMKMISSNGITCFIIMLPLNTALT